MSWRSTVTVTRFVLCSILLLSLAIWIDGYHVRSELDVLWGWDDAPKEVTLYSTGGSILLFWNEYPRGLRVPDDADRISLKREPLRRSFLHFLSPTTRTPTVAGFGARFQMNAAVPVRVFCVPWYAIICLILILCGMSLRRWLHEHRRRWWRQHGRCIHCGYDLRGTSGPTCSECGNEATE